MTARRWFWCAAVVLAMLIAALPLYAAKAKPASAPKIDVKAVQQLRAMTEYVSGLQSFSVHVQTTRDLVLPTDQALSSDLAYDLMVRRPDGLRVNMTSAAGSAQLFYDGKTLTIFTPKKNFYATTPAPATIAETVRAAVKRGISMPMAEFISPDSSGRVLANLASATFVGSSMVDGVMTNHLAFRQKKGVDWQIWIEDSATPLPRRLMIVDRTTRDSPRFVATLSDWNVSPTFDQSTFAFVAPEGAQQIKFKELPRPKALMKRAPK